MGRSYVNFPVDKEYKNFCEFMKYSLVSESNDFYVYTIPHNHLCSFLTNYEKWKHNILDKDAFVKLKNI